MNNKIPTSWCPLPWTHTSIKASGSFQLCCHSASSNDKGTLLDADATPLHVTTSKIEDVINNDLLKSVRKDMLEGKWPDVCIRCKRESESGMKSRNIYERDTLAVIVEPESYVTYDKAVRLTQADGTISNADFPLTYLDIRFGNLCNLKCTMCSPADSNQWYNDYVSIWNTRRFSINVNRKIELTKNENGDYKTTTNTFDWSDDINLWTEIEKYISQFRKVYIVGGEPLIIDSHYEFLQKCIDKGHAKNLTIEYNTNITNIPTKAWNMWKHFKLIIIGASIDGMGDVNNLIRYPSKWWKTEENYKKFSNAEGNFSLHVTCTVQVLNVWQFPEFVEYLIINNRNIKEYWKSSPLMLSAHPVHRPAYLNINILPDEFKEKLKVRYEQYKEKLRTTDYQLLYGNSNGASWNEKVENACRIIDTYIQFMHQINYTSEELIKHRADMIHFLDKLDQLRETDWKLVCPELYEATVPWRTLPVGPY